MFRRLAASAAQDGSMPAGLSSSGAPADRVSVTGTMKFDTAQIADRIPGDRRTWRQPWAWEIPSRCGSAVPRAPAKRNSSSQYIANCSKNLQACRLVIVPRKPERFDEVAAKIVAFGFGLLRRSGKEGKSVPGEPTVVLGDTIGELRKFYALADVVFVGRSLVDLGHRQHGSDMIEPAALGKPFVLGPFTANFADAMNHFKAADAVRVVKTASELQNTTAQLLADPVRSQEMGRKAQRVVSPSSKAQPKGMRN